jgi:leucyl-tRNA---protein transferase
MTRHSRDTPQFYLTAPSPCPYLPDRQERKVFTHLVGEQAGDLNDLLTQGGFRRSQSIAYRPACENCRACVSVRVLVDEFRPTRNMRRVRDRNADVFDEMRVATPTSEQYARRAWTLPFGDPATVIPPCRTARPLDCSDGTRPR